RGVHHAPLDEAEAGMALEGTQVFETTGGQVVKGPHFVSSLEELLHEMGPDEAGTSCDQDPHLFPRGADSRYLLPRSSAGPVSSMGGRAHRRRLRGCQRTRQYRYVKRRPPPLGFGLDARDLDRHSRSGSPRWAIRTPWPPEGARLQMSGTPEPPTRVDRTGGRRGRLPGVSRPTLPHDALHLAGQRVP